MEKTTLDILSIETVLIENWRYMVLMGPKDSWRLYGEVYGHPNRPEGGPCYTSTPVFLDRENRIVVTGSGRTYRLGVCAANEEEQFRHIESDVANGGTEHW